MSFEVRAHWMRSLMERLYPLHRSMTGEGVRATFDELNLLIPLTVHEVPSGTRVFDWVVPAEWRIRHAFVEDSAGKRLVDYANSNLHVMNGSSPIDATLPWTELMPHIHSLPDRPNAIPYRTAYFRNEWGFCVPHTLRQSIASTSDRYRVCIDSEHFDGSLSYAECTLPGTTDRSVLIYCHTCHPSLADDNLSGIVVATLLAQSLQLTAHRLTYRFVFAPATIGAITWLARNESNVVPLIDHGLVLSLLGNAGSFTYKRSRRRDSVIDRIASAAVQQYGGSVRDFRPFGYDERQFCSPGFDLAVGCLTRSPHGEFPEYHTSDDNLGFVHDERLLEALRLCEHIVQCLEDSDHSNSNDERIGQQRSYGPVNRFPKCEPFLRKYDLHRSFGQHDDRGHFQESVMWVLNLSDGSHSIEDIAACSQLDEFEIVRAASALADIGLLELNTISSIS